MYLEMKHTENNRIETMIYQNVVANVLLDEYRGHSSPIIGDLNGIGSHDFRQMLIFPLPDEVLSLNLDSSLTP